MLRFAAIVSAWTLLSRILGLLRDRFLAMIFGASAVLDAFLVAFALPNMLRNLFGEGALASAFVPRFVQQQSKDPAAARQFSGLVMTRLAGLLAMLSGLGMVTSAILLWSGVTGDTALVLALAIPQLPYMIFICVAAMMAGVLQAHQRFMVPAASPVLLNVVMITAIFIWRDVWVLPYAILTAGMAQCAFHCWGLWRCGAIPQIAWQQTPELRELRRSLIPILFASGVYQINTLLDSIIALWLVPAAGAVTVLYFANRLLQFPMALVTHAIGTALYPDLARGAEQGWAHTGNSLRQAGAIQAALLLPAAVGLMICAEPLVQLIYLTGAFDEAATQRCVLATQLFSIGLVPVGANKLFTRACHAHRDQTSPWRISLIAVGLNLTLNIALVLTPLAEAGLALASALSAIITMLMYTWLLRRRGAHCWQLAAWIRPSIGCALMAAVVYVWLHQVMPNQGEGGWSAAIRLGSAVVMGILVYGLVAGRDAWTRYRSAQSRDARNKSATDAE